MKLNRILPFPQRAGVIVARFGSARLVCQPNGRHELIGGTSDDHATAREWCSLFAPEVVYSVTPLAASPIRFGPRTPRSSFAWRIPLGHRHGS